AAGGFSTEAQLFAPDGQPLGGQFRIHQTTIGDQDQALILPLPDGGFAVTWRSTAGGGNQLFTRTFDADGQPRGDEVLVSEGTFIVDSTNTLLANGNYVAVYTVASDGSAWGVRARVYDSDGQPVTDQDRKSVG